LFFDAKKSLFYFGNVFVNFRPPDFTVFESYPMIITYSFVLVDVGNQLKVKPNVMVADDASI